MEEIEAYLQEEDFYGQCTIREGFLLSQEVREVDKNCFEDRRCSSEIGALRDESNEFFVGFREEDDCTCTNEDIGIPQNNVNLGAKRYKRQSNNDCLNCVASSSFNEVVGLPANSNGTPRYKFEEVTKCVGNPLPDVETKGRNTVKKSDAAAEDNSLGQDTATGTNSY